MKKFFLLIFLIFFGFLALIGCDSLRVPEFRGAAYTNPAPPPNFSLPSTKGGNFTLNEQTGKVILLFFGYTYCPDICPATMGTLKTALNELREAERENVVVVFVTVDPERDTIEQLERYLTGFNAGFVGVVPTLDELETLKGQYGFVAEKEDIQPDGSYLMAHTGLIYGINPKGELQVGFFSDMLAEDIAHDVQLLLRH